MDRLTEAAQAGDIDGLYKLIRENPNLLKNIDETPFVDTPLHIASSLGHTHFAVEIGSLWPSFGKKLNPDGLSAVHLAVLNGHTETAKRLISIDSELIRVPGKDRTTPLHCAAEMGNVNLLAEFLCVCPKSIEDLNIRCQSVVHIAGQNTNSESFNVLLEWLWRTGRKDVLNWKDEKGNTAFHVTPSTNQPQTLTEAAQAGDINGLYELIRENPNLLKNVDETPFIDTPLHIASSLGHTQFAVEIVSLWPSLGKKLNQDGHSAVHLAIQNGYTTTAKQLISTDIELIRARGKDGATPLLCAAEMGNLDLLAEFLIASPNSIEDLNIRYESVLHIAVRNKNFAALSVLWGWIWRNGKEDVLDRKDEKGNSVMHIAASTNQPQVVKWLIGKTDINAKNLEGLTALDIAMGGKTLGILRCAGARRGSSVPNPKTRADIFSRVTFFDIFRMQSIRVKKGLSDEIRSAVLVVAALIATATYNAVLNPPARILRTVNIVTAEAIFPNAKPAFPAGKAAGVFYTFYAFNSILFSTSIGLIMRVLPPSFHTSLLSASLIFLVISYVLSLMVIFFSP